MCSMAVRQSKQVRNGSCTIGRTSHVSHAYSMDIPERSVVRLVCALLEGEDECLTTISEFRIGLVHTTESR